MFLGTHAELFFGRLGLRLGAGYASPSLENDASTGVKLLTGDANLVWRLRRPYPGTFFQPYAVLGGGVVRYELDGDAAGSQRCHSASDAARAGADADADADADANANANAGADAGADAVADTDTDTDTDTGRRTTART